MGWIEKLHATYEACKGREPAGAEVLMPVSHTAQQAHIEITLDEAGNFKSARVINKEETVIPATEKSAGRTGKLPPPHPLCDKVQYCARDYPAFGGAKPSFFDAYAESLGTWNDSVHTHPKLSAIFRYISKGQVVADLISHKVLHMKNGKLLTEWVGPGDPPELFRLLTPKEGKRDQGDAFIRWVVWADGDLFPETWKDTTLQDQWIAFDAATSIERGVCMVTGDMEAVLASSHPKRIRHAGDGAKLISSNDGSGYTFRGRFTDSDGKQAAGVGFVVTQKAHSALRWLIKRQSYRNGDQVYVAWSVGGKPVPDPWADTLALLLGSTATPDEAHEIASDAGQTFARNLARAMAGYAARLDPTEDIVVMGLDSATPGRMAIIYYRELRGSEFLTRIRDWHARHAWPQNFGKDKRFTGAPAPHDIAEAAFGRGLDDKLKKATVERLLPCIVDGLAIPRDLVMAVVRRASNRAGLEHWEWEKVLGIACALFRGWSASQGKEYQMALEEERTSRDYLYGRLLAVADSIENYALTSAEKNRDTMAARLMQRFADRPYSTWRTIELALGPYKSRLKANERTAGFLWKRERLLDAIQCRFASADFSDDRPLAGEFLLGYHCQRTALYAGPAEQPVEESTLEENPA